MSSCFRCGGSPSTPKQSTLKTASDRDLRILIQQPNVPRNKKQLIQRELKRRNKENYGQELAKLFGTTPPPSNKAKFSPGNVLSKIASFSNNKTKRTLRRTFKNAAYYVSLPKTPKINPLTSWYRIKRKLPVQMKLLASTNERLNRNPKAYLNTRWRFASLGNTNIFYNTLNGEPFMINKKSGQRKRVPRRIIRHLIPRTNAHTWNAYTKRVENTVKKMKTLMKANNYATGRKLGVRLTNSQLRYYFQHHPRATEHGATTINNIRRNLKNSIQTNLFENFPVPNNENLQRKWLNLTNRNKISNIGSLIRKMFEYERVASRTWTPWERRTFDILVRRAINRNVQGFYF